MSQLLAFMLALLGIASLALAMDRHHRQFWRRDASALQRWLLRAVGVLGLVGALATCGARAGWSTGFVEWVGLISVAALCVGLSLAYLPKHKGSRSARPHPPSPSR